MVDANTTEEIVPCCQRKEVPASAATEAMFTSKTGDVGALFVVKRELNDVI